MNSPVDGPVGFSGPETSVIVTTYKWPRALELTLTALLVQTDDTFEVVVADDGSGPETAALLERFREETEVPIRHVWHEDRGYRKTKILNEAIRSTTAELLVFLDHDAIPARDLVARHRKAYAPNRLVPGGYIRLSREQSVSLDTDKVRLGVHEAMLSGAQRSQIRQRHRRNLFYIACRRKNRPKLLGMNFSVARDLLERVNGFDEEYRDWGTEDSDLRTRMRMAGGCARCLWDKAIVYHHWHPKHPTKARRTKNKERYRRLKRGELPWRCRRGLSRSPESRIGTGAHQTHAAVWSGHRRDGAGTY